MTYRGVFTTSRRPVPTDSCTATTITYLTGLLVRAAGSPSSLLIIEIAAPGGQAGSSSKIENYLGFPTGVSGLELATRAITQAEKFGAKMMLAHGVARLDCDRRPYKVVLDNGNRLAARSIVISTGAQYNK